ncbi:MAG: membrane protein insertion efficiency factor YidD [Alphaproteobacteria bacterium]|nr:membrane protein insertion efficiency factor YidD [Alphaproteobacteria bacterium]
MVGTVRWTLTLAIRGWQLLASPANGSSCAFYPTCSGYGLQAVKRNGPVLGAIMAAERINRNHDGWRYTPCEVNGRTYLYDPVSDNDFWMRRRRGGRR